MLKPCYGLGLSVSEIVHLKIRDIDSEQMKVLVERGQLHDLHTRNRQKSDQSEEPSGSITKQIKIEYSTASSSLQYYSQTIRFNPAKIHPNHFQQFHFSPTVIQRPGMGATPASIYCTSPILLRSA